VRRADRQAGRGPGAARAAPAGLLGNLIVKTVPFSSDDSTV